jgi:hypothetical protein
MYRQVNRSFAARYEAVKGSGLFAALAAEGLLVGHEEVDAAPADPDTAALVLRPELVDFVSYPFEWCPGQLRDAAQVTLRAQSMALDHGMTLRDASAYNVQFQRGRPVLIDTLSFEPLVEGAPWVAYRQFCQHFLAPLALMAHVDVRLGQLLRVHLDGVPLDLAAELLPARTLMQPGLAMHVRAHAASQRKHAGKGGTKEPDGATSANQSSGPEAPPVVGGARRRRAGEPAKFSLQAFRGLLASLAKAVEKQQWEPSESAWRDYYAAKESYSDDSLQHKEEIVAKLLADLAPSTVWDLGANTGRFSRIAAAAGAQVVALEMDPSAVELNWREVTDSGETGVLPLWMDLSNPTPSQGWAHTERPSLAERGPVDVALALALIHHLAIGGNVPLDDIAGWFATLTRRLIIEWVPKDDAMVQRLLATREDVFDDYTREHFETAVGRHFRIERREEVRGSRRILYVLHRSEA